MTRFDTSASEKHFRDLAERIVETDAQLARTRRLNWTRIPVDNVYEALLAVYGPQADAAAVETEYARVVAERDKLVEQLERAQHYQRESAEALRRQADRAEKAARDSIRPAC
jgi:hypothetical protein